MPFERARKREYIGKAYRTMVAPLTLFAADGETATNVEDRYVFRETFSSGTINTGGSEAACVAANGLFVSTTERKSSGNLSVVTAENDTLKYTNRADKDYVDIRFYYDETAHDLSQDFILSFWIKPSINDFKMTGWTWTQFVNKKQLVDGDKNISEETAFKISGGYLYVDDVKKDAAKLNKDEWALIEIVYNYDKDADAYTGEKGAVTSYTVLFNGVEIGTAAAD